MERTGILILCSCMLATVLGAKFPKSWTSCKPDENMNACLKDSIQTALVDLVPGMPSLGVLPLDPLHFDAITIDQGEGPVNIKLEFTDLDITGIKDMQIDSVNGDWKTMEIETLVPRLLSKGNYKVGGKILLLPIKGDGKCVLDMTNFRGHVKLHYTEKAAGSKTYYNVEKLDFDFDVENLVMQFDNLFNGDKALGDNMNKFLNQNWKEILHELKPNIAATFAVAFREISNRLFSRITKPQITPS
ncbi:JHBP [Nesidiocoris tenuis]|uniref:JHBP n=1 Tax=Nesidiocoris tenuis TaxID=355587 RepID=A0ABN7B3W6_9HEMI|nr:JHBP [Nesidiocoris tenuis]